MKSKKSKIENKVEEVKKDIKIENYNFTEDCKKFEEKYGKGVKYVMGE